MRTDLLPLLAKSIAVADLVVAGIAPDRLDAPTPCPGLTAGELTAHLVTGLDWFAGLPGEGPADPREVQAPAPDQLDALVRSFRAAAGRIGPAWTPELLRTRFTVPTAPSGTVTGAGLAAYMVVELLGHGWDLAVATGQPVRLPGDLAEAGLVVARELGEDTLRSPGMMGASIQVPATASAVDRLVAYLGRNPATGRSG